MIKELLVLPTALCVGWHTDTGGEGGEDPFLPKAWGRSLCLMIPGLSSPESEGAFGG